MTAPLIIKAVARYEADGKLFVSREKAVDHIQGLLSDNVKSMIQQLAESTSGFGLSASHIIPITKYIWKNREEFSRILSAELSQNEENEE